MRGYVFALITCVATWLLLVLGGIVNPTGSSLACPDWVFLPTCHGEVLPDEWTPGILIEHGHRLWASVVGLLTILTAVMVWKQQGVSSTTRKLALGAVFLVAAQGTLGGVTVLMGLHPVVSTGHLLTANIFFCLMVYIALRARSEGSDLPTGLVSVGRTGVGVVAGLILLQVVLGGVVRHFGAGPACGYDVLSCGEGQLWPLTGDLLFPRRLHMAHRILGVALALAVMGTCFQFRRRSLASERTGLARLAQVPMVLVVIQVALGVGTVLGFQATELSFRVPLVALHTAVGGLLLVSIVVCYVVGGPLWSRNSGQPT